ncbi:nitroreductase [Streptomyces sp. NPDC050315]|uniref:nitroreductase family protein n=1 Tax=Streptomyces sp. NPDC050315 TaxID=3155039 RepID=UPI00342C93AD
MDVAQAVISRRSGTRVVGPGPTDAELAELVSMAGTAPDHGRLSPWRLINLRGEARRALGEAMAASVGDEALRERTVGKALRAPLLITIVFRPEDRPKIPRWEQLAATVCAVQTLVLLLHDRGWSSIWRTGAFTEAAEVHKVLELAEGEQLLGWLYVGTAETAAPATPRALIDGYAKFSAVVPQAAALR